MESGDDLTFKIIFSGDGAGRLRERVKEKLKEFMGDYTDDTLVEYVIVLLKNGRRKEEARNELNVFLGDDSDSFVSWLWDHLQSNLNLYAQSKEPPLADEQVSKQKPLSESEVTKSDKLSKSRRIKDWKGVIRDPTEPPPLRSAVIANVHADNENNHSASPQRKRGHSGQTDHTDEGSQVKRDTLSKSTLGGASRRLLQFAVRDAVGTSRPTGLTSEPSFKRLRSAVSTPTDDSSLEDRPPKIRSLARVPKAMAVAIKAVADAAQDVVKVKPAGNVFDRLGRSSTDASDTIEDGKHEADVPTYSGQHVGDVSMMEHDGVSNKPHRVENIPVAKMANNYSNVHKPKGVSDLDHQKLVQETEFGAGNNSNPATVSNGNGVPVIHIQREVHQKTLPSIGVNPTSKSTDDVDSRTIFVSNVHFAATKDSLSRHFNKFGDVLKVVILTEAATGQPKGSAYVEFMRAETAENALSLDGTSFMSRILKVVKKNSSQQEVASPVTAWPRGAWGSPFVASRFGRASFPRGGIPSVYRSRLPIKGGARSLQWKRDAQNPSSDNISSPTAIPSPTTTTRSLTYVRTEAAKPNNGA
ncbi:putative RNA recognition motif domain, PWI domain, RNA-binding domain superfamily [Helianthus annuus]|uniref:Putative PWI domain, Nucleotide-binding alpha-beta plait domain protein n=1 Tax=Helianthus annuus TaxID=4232 RepID=A0A251VP96_HELAN|nr:nucleolar protein 12 isoform X1 [Helianthus annuus]XP_021976926.1 nucleolar protein 12 isoform X1 [Helianthus annuus]XP_035845900.1 nucleolar protein 12 isoform X1 [Helianthus annuus]KAF5822446.1 putative RNA recognition motif domain, PWI domain, RNA-binding domain superfamily [Helianthus annuus]KAJ0611915.1 putative nuclear polyadenylated RNA-binding protein Nab2/ZC3H14 [Helianthus annuus]KAJ0627276.1 putative nuclear polyadenylated RNA-binding protein Nab2/ZC3H14 [Helianthus annuus]KAJ09